MLGGVRADVVGPREGDGRQHGERRAARELDRPEHRRARVGRGGRRLRSPALGGQQRGDEEQHPHRRDEEPAEDVAREVPGEDEDRVGDGGGEHAAEHRDGRAQAARRDEDRAQRDSQRGGRVAARPGCDADVALDPAVGAVGGQQRLEDLGGQRGADEHDRQR